MHKSRAGFTLIELLVIIAIMFFITTVTLVYNGSGRNQVALTVESAKIASLVLQAKQLAIASYSFGSTLTCGYGVYFDQSSKQQYSLFIYSPKNPPVAGQCPDLNTIESSTWSWNTQDMVEYSGTGWQVPITSGLSLVAGGSANPSAEVVLFYPPNPTTLVVMQSDGKQFTATQTGYINLQTADGQSTSSIMITPAGQVTAL